MLLKKESNLYSFIHAKCPHCHYGDMFVNKNPYGLKDMSKMNKNCLVCGRSFFPETGFYWGAMYMSYMLTVFSSIFNVIFIGLIFGFEIYPLIIGNTILLIILYPLFFRYARVMWLQFNTPFSMEAFERAEAHLAEGIKADLSSK